MRSQCPNCPAAYELDDSRVPPAGLSIKCPKCKTPFTVHRPKAGEAKGSVPLPGSATSPAGKPAGARAAGSGKKPTTKAAVPLPGTDPFSATMQSAPPPALKPGRALVTPPPQSVVPLPGDAQGPKQMPAVPLPGLDDDLAPPSPDFQPPSDLDAAFAPAAASKPSFDDAFPAEETALAPKRAIQETDLAPKTGAGRSGAAAAPPEEGGMDFDFVSSPAAKESASGPAPSSAPPRSSELLDFVDDQPQKSAGRAGRAPPVVAAKPSPRRGKGRTPRSASGTGSSIFRPLNLVALLVLVALGGVAALGVRARRTPAGLFWTNRFFAGRGKSSAATPGVVSAGEAKLAQGTFSSAREALGAAAQLLASAPEDDEAQSSFVLCASELKFAYGQGGADWDQAKRVVDRIKVNARP